VDPADRLAPPANDAPPKGPRNRHTEGLLVVGWGIFLIIIGAGSLLLPMLGYQFSLMELVDDYQPYAGIVVAIIGVALVVYGMGGRRSGETPSGEGPTGQT
jgi:hypothetical protein